MKGIQTKTEDEVMMKMEEIQNMPDELSDYILKIIEELKQKCNEDLCAEVCDTEIKSWLKRIEDSIKFKKQTKIIKALEEKMGFLGNDNKLNEIANSIWDKKDIAKDVMIFLRAVRAWKGKALLRRGYDNEEIDQQLEKIDEFLENVQAKIEEEINNRCEPLRKILIEELKKVYSRARRRKSFSNFVGEGR